MNKKIVGFLLVALVMAALPALAHDGNAATSASGQKGLFELIYGENLCHGQWAFSTYYNKWDRRVQSDPATLAVDPLWTDWDMDVERASVAVGYGITDRIELSVMIPYWSFDGESIHGPNRSVGILNGVLFDQGRIDQSGLGNIRIGAKFQLHRTETYATALMAYVDAPTGDDDEAVVTGDPGLGLTFAYNNSAGWVFNGGYFDPGDSDFLEVSDEVRVGVGYAHEINDRTEWITELSGILYTDSNGEHDSADIASGARWRLSNPEWAFNAALRVDLSDTNFDYTPIGGLIGLSYSPKNKFSMTVSKEGSGTGTVRGQNIDCGSECSAKYHCGTTLTLEATPDAGSRFDGWSGDCAGNAPSSTLTLDGDKVCTARFIKVYDLMVEISSKKHEDGIHPGKGTVAITSPSGAPDCSSGCKVTYDVGTDVDLKAAVLPTPDGPSTFGGWSVDCDGSGEMTSVEMTSDKTCVATFIGPPRPCEAEIEVIETTKCAVYSKKSEWSCDAATWAQLVEGFGKDSADIPSTYLPTDENEKKTPLCDVVNFLRLCPQVKACIAGSESSADAYCTAKKRGARVASFLQAQSKYTAFENLDGRYTFDQTCRDEPDAGTTVEIFFE